MGGRRDGRFGAGGGFARAGRVRPGRFGIGRESDAGESIAIAAFAGGSDHDRAPDDSGVGVGYLHHVGHQRRDVVRRPGAQRLVYQSPHGRRGVREFQQQIRQASFADDAMQSVAGQQESVPGANLPDRQIALHRVDAVEGFGQEVPTFVGGGLLRRDPAGVDERLDEGVVAGQLTESAVPQQIGSGVADVGHRDTVVQPGECGDRGAHAAGFRCRGRHRVQCIVRVIGSRREQAEDFVVAGLQLVVHVQRREGCDCGRARQLTGRVAPHPVGHHQHARSRVAGVLVLGANQAHIGARRVAQREDHRHVRNSTTVRPMRKG